MKISVIVPVYNVAPYIAACLQSVMHQTCQDALECILVDDCGTDNSMEVVGEMLQSYEGPIGFKVVHHTQNRGLSAARNTGMAEATGDYVYFLDSDDEITPDCIQRLATPLQQEAFDMVVGECRIEGGSIPGVALQLPGGTILRGKEILHAYRLQQWYMMSVNKLYRLDFLRHNAQQFKEGILHEDELWSFQLACLAQSMTIISAETYIYKLRQGSITEHTLSPRHITSLNTILAEMSSFAQTHALTSDSDAHNIIRNFQLAVLHRASHLQIYRQQRNQMKSSWLNCLSLNGTDIKKQLRDLHLALPIPLAIPYLKLLLKYQQKLDSGTGGETLLNHPLDNMEGEGDVLESISEEIASMPVEQIMVRTVISTTPDAHLIEVLKAMMVADIGRLPVLEQGVLVGTISRSDIIFALYKKKV